MMEGRKDDAGKPAYDLIPWDVLIAFYDDNDCDLTVAECIKRLGGWWRYGDDLALAEVFWSIVARAVLGSDSSNLQAAAEALVPVLEYGAKKYAAWNWSKGMKWSRVYAAALRHAIEVDHYGDDARDEETGLLHLQHWACCLLFLLTYQQDGIGEDDRPDHKPKVQLSAGVSSHGGLAMGEHA